MHENDLISVQNSTVFHSVQRKMEVRDYIVYQSSREQREDRSHHFCPPLRHFILNALSWKCCSVYGT